MKALKDRIIRDGKCFEGGILKVDNFINHQMDPILMKSMAVEFVRRFASTKINKILTIEASGIAPAIMVGYLLELPVVFAKKKKPSTMENMLTTTVYSFTKDRTYDVCVSKDYLCPGDKVLFIDDFLANGNAAKGIIDLVQKAEAELVGMGFLIEKSFQHGGDYLRAQGIHVESLAIIELIYGLNDRPPLKDSIFAALQHLLAIFVAIITPPLIIAGALKLDLETTGFLVSMALFASGISTFIQCRRVGPIGCGLLCIQGTSFSFIGPIISAGLTGGLSAIFGACIVASSVEMLISRVLKYTRRVITPLVSGIVVTLIGMSLIKVGISACGGGAAAQADGTFGAFRHIGLAALVLVLIIFFNRSSNRYLRMSSIVIGLVVGYVLAWALGMVDFSAVQSYGGFNIPIPFRYGISFDISAIIALALVYLITAIEAYGDITANSLISGEPVEGETFVKRASGGILADGFNSMLAGFFNSFPNSIFAQNNGMIQLTGVASRYVGYFIAGFLILLGLFPAVGLIFSLMPEPVLGGATLLMFGTVAAAGIRIISAQKINRKATLVMALSFSFGLSVELVPDILCQLPETVRNIFSSGITTGGLTAILSNLLIQIKE